MDSDEDEEKKIDLNISGDTSEEAEKQIQKTYVSKKCDRLMREADEEESERGDEELKINADRISDNHDADQS